MKKILLSIAFLPLLLFFASTVYASDKAVSLSGSTSTPGRSYTSGLALTNFTYSLWFYPTVNNQVAGIWEFGNGSYRHNFALSVNGANKINTFHTADPSNTCTSSNNYTLNAWNHVIVTLSGGNTYTIYLNDVKTSCSAGATISYPTSYSGTPLDISLGDSLYPNQRFTGYIDELVIYNSVFSDSQASDDYNSGDGVCHSTSGTTALYRFDDDTDDSSSNSYNLSGGTVSYVTGKVSCSPTLTTISTSPSSSTVTVGSPFNVDVKVEATNSAAFNAARANVAVSSNLSITGIHAPTSNACSLQYTQTPTTNNPSFAGGIFGGSSTGCTVYTMTLTPTATGTGTITFTNASVKSYDDNSEILTGVENGSFTITDGPTPTPTPLLEFQITNLLQTYKTNFNLTGTKLSTITSIFVNSSDANSTYPTSTTWEVPVTLTLGENNFAIYGSDGSNQTATQTITVSRHTLGDINGDEVVDLIDASLFAVDWDKTENLTYNLSDMNDDGVVDLTDLSILAKLIQ